MKKLIKVNKIRYKILYKIGYILEKIGYNNNEAKEVNRYEKKEKGFYPN